MLTHGECNVSGCSYAHSKKELRVNVEVSSSCETKPRYPFERMGGCTLLSKCNSATIPGLRDFVNDLAPQPRKPHPPEHLQPPPGLDIPEHHTFEKNGSNLSSSARRVKPHTDLTIPGNHALEKEGRNEAISHLGDPMYVQPSESMMLHMSNLQWPSIIGDRPVVAADELETGGEISALVGKNCLKKSLHNVWGSESTLCSLADLVEM